MSGLAVIRETVEIKDKPRRAELFFSKTGSNSKVVCQTDACVQVHCGGTGVWSYSTTFTFMMLCHAFNRIFVYSASLQNQFHKFVTQQSISHLLAIETPAFTCCHARKGPPKFVCYYITHLNLSSGNKKPSLKSPVSSNGLCVVLYLLFRSSG